MVSVWIWKEYESENIYRYNTLEVYNSIWSWDSILVPLKCCGEIHLKRLGTNKYTNPTCHACNWNHLHHLPTIWPPISHVLQRLGTHLIPRCDVRRQTFKHWPWIMWILAGNLPHVQQKHQEKRMCAISVLHTLYYIPFLYSTSKNFKRLTCFSWYSASIFPFFKTPICGGNHSIWGTK